MPAAFHSGSPCYLLLLCSMLSLPFPFLSTLIYRYPRSLRTHSIPVKISSATGKWPPILHIPYCTGRTTTFGKDGILCLKLRRGELSLFTAGGARCQECSGCDLLPMASKDVTYHPDDTGFRLRKEAKLPQRHCRWYVNEDLPHDVTMLGNGPAIRRFSPVNYIYITFVCNNWMLVTASFLFLFFKQSAPMKSIRSTRFWSVFGRQLHLAWQGMPHKVPRLHLGLRKYAPKSPKDDE